MFDFIKRYFLRRKARRFAALQFYREVPLFAGIRDYELQMLFDLFIYKHFKKGEYIFRENFPNIVLYIIQSGRVKLHFAMNNDLGIINSETTTLPQSERGNDTHRTPNTEYRTEKTAEYIIKEIGAGQSFGEVGMFTDAPRVASAIALENTMLIAIKQTDLKNFIKKNPATGIKLLYNLTTIISKDFIFANEILKQYVLTNKDN